FVGFIAALLVPHHGMLPTIPQDPITGIGVSFGAIVVTAANVFFPLIVIPIEVAVAVYLAFSKDPSIAPIVSSLGPPPESVVPSAQRQSQVAAGRSAGPVDGTVSTPSLTVSGPVTTSWSSGSTSSLHASTISVPSGVVEDAAGNLVGSGAMSLQATAAIPTAVS